MQFAEPKTADQLLARMTQVEKITIRHATTDERLDYLANTSFRSDGATFKVIKEIKDRLERAYTEHTNGPWWTRQTWDF